MTFNPFLDLSSKSDDDIMNDLTRIYSMISHYHNSGNTSLTAQLQTYRDTYQFEMESRSYQKQLEKANKESIVIDTSDEANLVWNEKIKPKNM